MADPILSDREIQAIIARVKGRVAAAEFAARTGPALEAADALEASDVQLGDGIHRTIDESVSVSGRLAKSIRISC